MGAFTVQENTLTKCIKVEKWRLLVQRRTNIPLWEEHLIKKKKKKSNMANCQRTTMSR